MPGVRRLVALCLAAAACSGGAVPATTTSAFRAAAREYAASADRALDGTVYSEVPVGTIADALVGLCSGEGGLEESIDVVVADLDVPETAPGDAAILVEVLTEGAHQVCPELSGAGALLAAYLGAVTDAVASVAPDAAIDGEAVLAAGRVTCDLLDRGQGPDSALLGIAAALFGVEATSPDELASRISDEEGVIAGATLGSAVAYLCSGHQAEVAAFLQGLDS